MATEKSIGEQAEVLGKLFEKTITAKFGNKRSPEPLIMSTGITHLDALLGGGLISSGPVMVSSTPESGKSTFAFQMSSMFHKTFENGIIVYIDIEGSGSSQNSNEYKMSRIDTFGLAKSSRFRYEPVVLDIKEFFDLIGQLVEQKLLVEKKTGREFYVLIVWDSVAATRSSKTDLVESHDRMIGYKARELSFYLEKVLPLLKFNRIYLLCIDQIRANIQIDGPYAQKEKSVGEFKNFQSASNTFSLLHNIQQWLFLSRGKKITPADGYGIEGWHLNILTEKNKLAPSQHSITCMFDMHKGLDKFWSEYLFLSEPTPSENKIYKNKKVPFQFMIEKASAQRYQLNVFDPNDSSTKYTSGQFYKKDAKKKYSQDEEFRNWFDFAVKLSAHHRITMGMFQESDEQEVIQDTDIQETSDIMESIEQEIESPESYENNNYEHEQEESAF